MHALTGLLVHVAWFTCAAKLHEVDAILVQDDKKEGVRNKDRAEAHALQVRVCVCVALAETAWCKWGSTSCLSTYMFVYWEYWEGKCSVAAHTQ